MKSVFREPNWELKSKEDRSIERVLFIEQSIKLAGGCQPLLSCHVDGVIRLWNAFEGKMLVEHDVQMLVDEGLTCLAINQDGSLVLIGGCFGHVRILEMKSILDSALSNNGEELPLNVTNCWRAHLNGVTCVNFIDHHKMILTGSIDCAVRQWSFDGTHVGTFGDQPWCFSDPLSRKLPRDLQHEIEMDELMNRSEAKRLKLLNKKIISTWKGKKYYSFYSPTKTCSCHP